MASVRQTPLSSEERQNLKEKVIKLVRAILIPEKAGLPVEKVNREYREFNGEGIPFRKIGYSSLEDFLEQNPHMCRIHRKPDGWYLYGVATQETAHIVRLVSQQRSKRPKARPKPARRPHLNPNRRFMWSPPVTNGQGFQRQQRRLPAGSGRFTGGGMVNGSVKNRSPPQNNLRAPNVPQQPTTPAQRKQQPVKTNSNPKTSPKTNNSVNNSLPSDHFKQLLNDYFVQNNLGLVTYKTALMEVKSGPHPRQSKGKTVKKYICTVKVHEKSYRTFPDEYPTSEMAEEAAAKIACNKLNITRQTLSSNGVSNTDNDYGTWTNGVTCDNLSSIIDRIVKLVGTRTNGVWSTQIEVEYSRQFKGEKLPDNWPEKIEKNSYGQLKLRIDRPIQDFDRCIVLPNLQPVTEEISANDMNNLSITEEPTKSSVNDQAKPPALALPQDAFWNVYVTCVHSTMNVGLRLLGDAYSSEFDDLVTNMELHYFEWEKMPPITQPVVVGKLYAAKVEGDWHRVEVTDVKGKDITSYFIDHGDEEVFTEADLREIDPKFLTLAPQAKHVRLAGLEAYKDSSEAQVELSNMALGKSLVGSVYANDENGISLILIDTSGEDTDVNINQLLLEKLTGTGSTTQDQPPPLEVPSDNHFKPMPPPRGKSSGFDSEPSDSTMNVSELMSLDLASLKSLNPSPPPAVNDFFDVTVTLAASPSNFTVQSYASEKSLEELQTTMNAFYNDKTQHYKEPLTSEHLSKDSFFAGQHADGVWYRVKVNSMLDESTAAVKMVDFGDFAMIAVERMQPLWPPFRNLPMQAINASLADIVAANGDWTPDDTVWFTKRVVGKQFVSKVKDVSVNFQSVEHTSYKLSVSLFDTSDPDQDAVVDKELVDQGRAVYLCL